MNYYSFRLAVQQEWAEVPHLRLGQVYFNLLNDLRPDLATRLRGGIHDPFHKDVIPPEAEELVQQAWDDSIEFPDL